MDNLNIKHGYIVTFVPIIDISMYDKSIKYITNINDTFIKMYKKECLAYSLFPKNTIYNEFFKVNGKGGRTFVGIFGKYNWDSEINLNELEKELNYIAYVLSDKPVYFLIDDRYNQKTKLENLLNKYFKNKFSVIEM